MSPLNRDNAPTPSSTKPTAHGVGIRAGQSSWPADARDAMGYLEQGAVPRVERRRAPRHRYRTPARFAPANADWSDADAILYTRDVTPWSAGFITLRALDTGTRGALTLTLPDGSTLKTTAVVRRTREFRSGWYEGVLQFSQPQPAFQDQTSDE